MKFFVRDGKRSAKQKALLIMVSIMALVVQPIYGPFASQIADAAPYGDMIVRQSENAWSASNTSSGTSSYVLDATAPYGNGVLQMTTPSGNNASKATRAKTLSPNVKLSDITALSYWTKQVTTSNPTQTISLQLTVNGLTGTTQSTTLVFEPYWNVTGHAGTSQNLPNSVWQQWNAKDGLFWSTKTYSSAGLVNGAGGPPFYTLAQVIANNPNAKVTSLIVNIGTYNPGNVSLVDGVNFNGVVYDFEPVAPVPPATPTNLRLNGDKICGYATNVNSITPTWDAVAGAVSYNYQVVLPGGGVYGPVNVGNVTSVTGPFGAQGTSTFSVQAVAANGLTSDWATPCAVSYDITPPTGTDDLSSPIRGTVVITQHVDDNIAAKSGKLRIWKLTNGVADNSKFFAIGDLDVDVSGNIQYILNTLTNLYGDGEYVAKFTGTDTASNATITTQKNFVVDNTAPDISISSYQGDIASKVFREVSFKIHDAGSKIDRAELNGKPFTSNHGSVWGDFNSVWANKGWSGAQQGVNTLVLYDMAGNSSSYTFTIDIVAPSATFDYSNNHGNQLTRDDVIVTMTTTEPIQTPTGWTKVSDTEFTKVYDSNGKQEVVITDIAGNVSTPQKFEVKRIDRNAPTISGVSNGAIVKGPVSLSIFDPKYQGFDGFDQLHGLTVDGVEAPTTSGPDKTYLYTIMSDGLHVVVATDKAGNSTTIAFTVDSTPPTIEDLLITKSLTNENSITVSGTVFDVNLKDYNLRVYKSDKSGLASPWIGYTGNVNINNGTLGVLNISSLVDGDYWVRIWADDLAGNRAGISSQIYLPFTVDRTAPDVTVNAIADGANTTPVISGTTSEKGGDVTILIDGSEVATVTSDVDGNWSYTPATALAVGPHTVIVVATDAVGNTSSSDTSTAQPYWTTFGVMAVTPPNSNTNGNTIAGDDEINRASANQFVAPGSTNASILNTNNNGNATTDTTPTTDEATDTDVLAATTTDGRKEAGEVLAAQDTKGNWSVVNLVLAVITIILSLAALLGLARKKDATVTRILTLVPVAIAVTTFLFIENLSASMIWLNWWTVLYAVILAIQIVILSGFKNSREY